MFRALPESKRGDRMGCVQLSDSLRLQLVHLSLLHLIIVGRPILYHPLARFLARRITYINAPTHHEPSVFCSTCILVRVQLAAAVNDLD